MKKRILLTATAVATFATSSLLAQMNMDMGGMDMDHGGAGAHQHTPAAQASLPEPAKSVFDNYLKIQTALARDSLQGVSDNAMAIMTTVQNDSANHFAAVVAPTAAELTKAKDVSAARDAFKRLSIALISYLGANTGQAGHFEKVFCSMAKAQWLQPAGSMVSNPYLGKAMSSCGQIQN